MVAAVTDAYATASEYRAVVSKTDTAEDTEILRDLKAVSRYLDRHLGRFFTVDAADVTRLFVIGAQGAEPSGGWTRLWVPDLSAAPTSIKIDEDDDGSFADETALPTADYELYPLNALLGPEPRPYEAIGLTSYGDQGNWPDGVHVEIVGKWGWPAVPNAIVQATIQLAGILRIESPRATTRVAEGLEGTIGASVEAQRIVWQLAKAYRRVEYG